MTPESTSADGVAPPIEQAVSDLVRQIEGARAAEDYRAACIARMAGSIQLAALTARAALLAQIMAEASATIWTAPAAATALAAGLQAADAESRRLLLLLDVNIDGEDPPPAKDESNA